MATVRENLIAAKAEQPKLHLYEGFETWVDVAPSFYWMRADPSRNYGVGNVTMTFFLRGPKGAIQFKIGTEWGIKPVRDHLAQFDRIYAKPQQPSGWDLGYHAYEAQYDGQEPMGECRVLGCACFYDGSGLQADEMIEGFMAGGPAGRHGFGRNWLRSIAPVLKVESGLPSKRNTDCIQTTTPLLRSPRHEPVSPFPPPPSSSFCIDSSSPCRGGDLGTDW